MATLPAAEFFAVLGVVVFFALPTLCHKWPGVIHDVRAHRHKRHSSDM